MRDFKNLYIIFLLCLIPFSLFGGNDSDNSLNLYLSSSAKSISQIDSLIQKYPDDYRFKYEKSLLVISQGDIKQGKRILDSLFLKGIRDENLYRLLINCNMQVENIRQAKFVMDSAMYYYPNSAKIMLEQGYLLLNDEDKKSAAGYFEKGIYLDPQFCENYFPLIDYYHKLDINLWSLIYGEIFINISDKDSLTQLASANIYNNFKKALDPNFSEIIMIDRLYDYIPGEIDTNNYDFEIGSQQTMLHTLHTVAKNNKTFNIKFIYDFFKEFDKQWTNSIYIKKWNSPVYEYHNLLIKNNLLEPYIYLIYGRGDIEEFTGYAKKNIAVLQKLVRFMEQNKIKLDNKHYFNRTYHF